jgi:hypothetical protein
VQRHHLVRSPDWEPHLSDTIPTRVQTRPNNRRPIKKARNQFPGAGS